MKFKPLTILPSSLPLTHGRIIPPQQPPSKSKLNCSFGAYVMLAEADARSAAFSYEGQVRSWIASQAFNISMGCFLLSNEFIPKLDLPGLVANRRVISYI